MKFGGKRGFTLLELMITIGIIGILSAIAIPTYRNYVVTAKRSAENYDLTSDVNTAGNEFVLSLVAKGGQTGDKKACQQLAINHLGRKYSGCTTLTTCGSASADSESNKCW